MGSATNMFSCLEGDEEGSAIMEEREQKKLKEEEEEIMEQKNVMEMQKKLKKQEERERKQSELTHMFMEALPFKFPHHQKRRLPNRREQNQNSDAKNHGEGSNVSERDQGRDAKRPSSNDQKSNVSENHIGGDEEAKFDDGNKDNGAEGANVAAEQKDSKTSKKFNKKKSEADDKSVSSDKKDEDYLTMVTLAEYEKELEKRKALKSDEKTDRESKETPDNALESDPKERKKTLDKDFDSTQLLQNETYEDDALFIKVAGKHVKRVHGASKQEGRSSNGVQQSINGERPVGRKGFNGVQGEKRSGSGRVHALTLKDSRKFPDIEDTKQFPALGGPRKA